MPDPIAHTVGAKVVENLIGRILDFILNPITVRITVVRKCNQNVENLKAEVENLKAEKKRLENHKKDVGRRGEVIDDTVQTWLTKAEEFIEAAGEPIRVGDEFAKECFFGLCPNPIPRYKLSKKAEKNSQDIAQHLEVARGFGTFPLVPSRMAVLNQIMDALRNPTVNKIGVYGASGVGKTTLVKMVKEKAKQDSLFTAVVMATVTKDRGLESIQEDIARDLGMDRLRFRENTGRQVADSIKAKLKEEKKFLVILDDVWETEIDFEKFGIPSASEMKQAMEKKNEERSSGQEDLLCKILLTSRFHDVLSGIVGENDPVFEVGRFEDDEAWHLFKKIVGSNVESSNFQPKAKEIVEKCIGLPVAIVSVAKAMKGKTQQFEWEDALTELKRPSPAAISAAVYKPIELSYNNLKEEGLKQTFILCSLLGRDSSIDDLLKCGMGLDLFQKVKTIEETRARVLRWVSHLKQSSLLVDGKSSLHFDMHDQIREVALSIAFRDHGGLALVDEVARKKLKDKKTLEKLKWISLPNGDIELPANGLQCPQLTFFYLSNKAQPQEVPLEFFRRADGLKVLCLIKIDFKSMRSPIPFIPMNLHSLLLDQCVFKVEDLGAIMGNLENLEVLSLVGCDIEELPRETEKLSRLKLLDVSDCTKLKVIPRQVIARLSKLEELKIGNSFDQWDDVEGGNARLAELTELRMLTALEVRIPNFQETLFLGNLERFKIFIGIVSREPWDDNSWDSNSWNSSFQSSKIMKLNLQGASIKCNDSVQKLLKKTEELYLEGLNGVESLVELDDEGFQHLKCLHVQNAPDIRCILNPAGRLLPSHVFPSLDVLILFNLEKMEKICHGLTGAAPFKVLRKITVVRCHELKNLFSFSMARQIQLQEIIVEDCNNIEEIIGDVEEQGNENDIVEESEGCKLGSLRSLTLGDLPKLISFNSNCSGISLFNDKVEFPNLKLLKLSSININQIWNKNHEEISCFKKLQHLEVCNCSNLSYLLTPSMALSVVQLKDLKIKDCATMEHVIRDTGVEEVVETGLIFPQLNSILLESCSKLSSFYVGSNIIKFPMLEEIIVKNCLKRVRFASKFPSEKEIADRRSEEVRVKESDIFIEVFFSDEVEIPILKTLTLSLINIKQIWNYQLSSISSFAQHLTKLKVVNCSNLKYLFTFSMVKSFVQLEELGISECEMMEVVILIKGTGQEEKICRSVFPKLETLILNDLPQLATFCSNCDSLGEVSDSERVNIGTGSKKMLAMQSTLVETEATKLVFSQVTYLILRLLPKFKSFFPQTHITERPSLKCFVVIKCHGAQIVASEFSSTEMTHGDSQLERESQHLMFRISKVVFSNLEELTININQLWVTSSCAENPQEILNFKKLKCLQISNCSGLEYLFTPSLVLGLVQLEDLKVSSNENLKQVIMVKGVEEVVNIELIFPRLNSILLWDCEKLSRFYAGSCALKFQSAVKITIGNCPNMITFASTFSTEQEKETAYRGIEGRHGKKEPDIPSWTLFYDAVEITLSDTLDLCSINVQQIWHIELSSMFSLVQNLRKLTVRDCGNLKYLFTSSMVEFFVQLKVLKIFECQLMEVVILIEDSEDEERVRQKAFPKLNVLELMVLPQFIKFCGTCNSLVEISEPQGLMNGSGSQVLSPTS